MSSSGEEVLNHKPQFWSLTNEKGNFSPSVNGDVHFIGSSSGVHFFNAVKNAFRVDSAPVVVDDSDKPLTTKKSQSVSDLPKVVSECVHVVLNGPRPSRKVADDLIAEYFGYFHPVLPFIYGPVFLSDLDNFCQNNATLSFPKLCLIRIILSIGHRDFANLSYQEAGSLTTEQIHLLISILMLNTDIETIQALLAIQVYYISIYAIRSSHEVGGIIRAKALNLGLNKCPVRYTKFSPDVCELRKRIFWCAYSLDRYISQTIGMPHGFSDEEHDICKLGNELHLYGDLPQREQDTISTPDADNSPTRVCVAFSDYANLVGKIISLFNSALTVRQVNVGQIMALRADVENWWNSLPDHLQLDFSATADSTSSETKQSPFQNAGFFSIAYQHLLLLLDRPGLSLPPDSNEFRYSLQACIGHAKNVIHAMATQGSLGQKLFWPGYLYNTYMSGLLLAFACHFQMYPLKKTQRELAMAIDLLAVMAKKWPFANRCVGALSELSNILAARFNPAIDTSLKREPDDLMPGQPKKAKSESLPDDGMYDESMYSDNIDLLDLFSIDWVIP